MPRPPKSPHEPLILPPDYQGEVPEGYLVLQTNTYGNWVLWRGYQVDGSTETAVSQTKERFRIYPLSQTNNPPGMTFVDVSGKAFNTIHRMDVNIFDEINAVIQREPSMGERPELLGHLAAIGIVKGQELAPDSTSVLLFVGVRRAMFGLSMTQNRPRMEVECHDGIIAKPFQRGIPAAA